MVAVMIVDIPRTVGAAVTHQCWSGHGMWRDGERAHCHYQEVVMTHSTNSPLVYCYACGRPKGSAETTCPHCGVKD